jgi:competence protein ComEC
MNAHILWALVLGFVTGVFLRSLVPLEVAFVGFMALLGSAALLLGILERKKLRACVLVAVALFACASGIARMGAAVVTTDPILDTRIGEKVVLEGVVSHEPDAREASTRILLRAGTIIYGSATTSVSAGVLVITSAHVGVAYGDLVRAEGTLRLPEAFETGEGREFNYPAYLAKDGIVYELSFATVEAFGKGARNPLKAVSIYLKQLYLDGIARALPEPHGGLAGGITAGDKRGLGEDLSATFRTVSLTHIIVLSGYNIMIVVFGLGWLFARFRVGRWVEFGLGVAIAAFFALITGLAAASVRAAAMASIAMVGKVTGRVYLASRALAVVALGMVLWNPYVLVFDIGFQLSIIATWGLVTFSPIVAAKLSFITERFALREIAAATIGTQIAVLPLLLYQSGALSLYALPVNLLVLIVVPWAMLFSAIAAFAGLLLVPLAPIAAFPAYALLSYMTGIANLFASLPFSSIAIPAFSAGWLVTIYVAMLLFILKYERSLIQ